MMQKSRILYLSPNDGSDMRINKELSTLKKEFDVIYLGIGNNTNQAFGKNHCIAFDLVNGRYKSLKTIIIFWYKLIKLFHKHTFHSVHVVDEQFYALLIPVLFKKKVTLDIFDSIFLKLNKPNNKCFLLKKLIYSQAENIIVTDKFRKALLPFFAFEKTIIIPNVPFKRRYKKKQENKDVLVICYFGSLQKHRGSEFALNLVNQSSNIRVVCAGWVNDTYTEEKLLKHQQVQYLGVLKQFEANDFLSLHGDYLLSIYPTNNMNNIYASPNKIYDSIHTKTPIIINEEVKVSNFIKEHGIGYLVKTNSSIDYAFLTDELFKRRRSFEFDDHLTNEYCWENFEERLLDSHRYKDKRN